jgi:hypothetical protein
MFARLTLKNVMWFITYNKYKATFIQVIYKCVPVAEVVMSGSEMEGRNG